MACNSGERLALRYRIFVIDLGVINDIKELDENCQGIALAGMGGFLQSKRREERRGKNHGEQPTLQRWTEGEETVLVTI